jgi:hypothetical protein
MSSSRKRRGEAQRAPGEERQEGTPQGAQPLDHLRHIWKGPDGGLAQPPAETWIDREAKILTVMIIHADNATGRVRGYTLEYLCRKARVSRSDWFRGLPVLLEAGVVSVVPRDKVRSKKTGKIHSLPNDYILHPDRLLAWTAQPRPTSWPGAEPPAPAKAAGPGAYLVAFEEAQRALGLSADAEDVQEQRLLMERADREARRLAATEERLNRELARLAKRREDFERLTAARALTAIVALRQQAGLEVEDFLVAVGNGVAGASATKTVTTPGAYDGHGHPAQQVEARLGISENAPFAGGDGTPAAAPVSAETIANPSTYAGHREYVENRPAQQIEAAPATSENAPFAEGDGAPPSSRPSSEAVANLGTSQEHPRALASGPRRRTALPPDDVLLAFARAIASRKDFARNILARVEQGRELTNNEREALAMLYAEAHPPVAARAPPSSRPERAGPPQERPLWGPAKVLRLKIQRHPREP